MPEFGIRGTERPAESFQRNSRLDMTVFRHINRIVNIDKVKLIHLPENRECRHCQNDINNQFLFIGTDIYFFYDLSIFSL